MDLKIFRLRLIWHKRLACTALVFAENEEEARKLAAEEDVDFLDREVTTCEEAPFEKGVALVAWNH